ncbi:hypothetical protein [uncultured Deefgea sp.]|uniref:hypothetical protein n=1 Tax=uncultured Deefgea sp. TaxID=1304914 RepID=UPI00262BDEBB|nr:hypothetical protein [uncultured Deefgea sp.]
MPSIKKIFFMYGVNGAGFLFALALIPIVTLSFGVEGYGAYSVYVILSSFLVFLDSTISRVFVAELLSDKWSECNVPKCIEGAYICIFLCLLLLLPFLVYLFGMVFPVVISSRDLTVVVLLAVFLEYIFSLPISYLQVLNVANKKHECYSIVQFFSNFSRFLFVAFGAAFLGDIFYVFVLIIVRKAIDIAFCFRYSRGVYKLGVPSFNVVFFRTSFSSFRPLVATVSLQVLLTEMFSIYLNKVYGTEIFGRYRLIYDLVNKIWFISTLYPVFVFPRLCELWREKTAGVKKLVEIYSPVVLISAYFYSFFCLTVFLLLSVLIYSKYLDVSLYYVFGVVFGVSVSAHNKLLFEFAQATGGAVKLFRATFVIVVFSGLLLYFFRGVWLVGFVWVASQFTLMLVLEWLIAKQLNVIFVVGINRYLLFSLLAALYVMVYFIHVFFYFSLIIICLTVILLLIIRQLRVVKYANLFKF